MWDTLYQAYTHSRMEHYFFSYLLTCEGDLFENSATKSYIVTFFHVKSIKVTSGINLRWKKKSARWRCHAEKSKTNLKTLVSPLWMRLQGSQGCQKMRQDPLNMPCEVWCANIALKLKNIWKSLSNRVFWWFFFNFDSFLQFLHFEGNLSAKEKQFHLWKKNVIWGRVHIDLDKNSVAAGCV